MEWYPQGLSLDKLPLPVPDPKKPWGSTSCSTCSGFCAGHYFLPKAAFSELDSVNPEPSFDPPSTQLKEFFSRFGSEPPENELKLIASKCLLPEDDVLMWLKHLQTITENRKRGASKAAETRRRKKESYPCGVCQALYGEADEVQLWIACDGCNTWFHAECVNVSKNNEPDEFFCESCA